jgi:UDP-N-acetylmuramate dehydrogenase
MTSWRIGGPARAFAEPGSPEELIASRREAERRGWPIFLVGGGSNILVSDDGYPGLVIRYADRTHGIDARGDEAIVRAGARVSLARLAREVSLAGWRGLEWAEGIPGTIAGAAVGNAGAYGGDIAGVLDSIDVLLPDGTRESWPAERLDYGYRHSVLKGKEPTGPVVLEVRFRVQRDDPDRLAVEVKRIAAERKAKTPTGLSCGSVFRNPPEASAGRLIEEAGCKGMRIGAAVVSEKHANYIVNQGGARALDVLELIDRVRTRVRAATGISLELEIQPVGFGQIELS